MKMDEGEIDYKALAAEFMHSMFTLNKARPQKHIHQSMKGGAFVLHYLSEREGCALPGEISAAMDISTARIAVALNLLEKKGYITRQIDPADRRRVQVALTDLGKDWAAEERVIISRNLERMLLRLGKEDALAYVRITAKLAKFAQEIKTEENGG